MRLKPKRRLLLLAAITLVLALGAFSFFVVRGWQRARLTEGFLTQALAAYQARDYYDALEKAGAYLRRVRTDSSLASDPRHAEAVLAYADSRRSILEHDGHNYRDCLSFYSQYLSLRPDDRDARLALLRTYNICGYGPEAMDLAAALRPSQLAGCTADDLPVLREEATACLNGKSYERLDRVAGRILELAPTDLSAHRCRIRAMANRGERAAARAYADAVLNAHPDDLAALLIAAISRQIAPTPDDAADALRWTSTAAGLDPKTGARARAVAYPQADHALQAIDILDRLRQFDRSLAVLRESAAQFDDPDLHRNLARRLWQDGGMDELIERTQSLDLGSPTADPDVIAFRAMALRAKGRNQDADALEQVLSIRKGDYRIAAWAKALPLLDPARAPKPAEAVQKWREIVSVKCSPNEPIYRAALAEALAAVGRTEEARAEWDAASRQFIAASWSIPFLRTAQTLLAEGRAEEAARAAHEAYLIAGSRAPVVALWFETQAAAIQKGATAMLGPAAALAELERTLEALATATADPAAIRTYRERLLVPHIIFLAHSGQRDKARDLALASLQADPPLLPENLQRLAATSRIEKLGIDEQIMSRLESAATPDAALTRAIDLAEDGKTEEAISLLTSLAAANPEDPIAQTALPRLYDRLARPEAKGAWIALADRSPNDLAIQRAALQSTAAAEDPAFVARTVDRYLALTGGEAENDPVVVCARARALMAGNPGRAERDRAVAMLGAFVTKHQRIAEPRVLLASVLTYSRPGEVRPDVTRAIAQLTDAAALEPRSAPIALQLGRLLQLQGQYALAREHLTRIASDPAAERMARRTAAEMLIAQGDAAGVAINTLRSIATQMGEQAPARLLVTLADASIAAGRPEAAKPIYEQLAGQSLTDPDAIYAVARYFTRAGDQARAQAALDRLEAINPGAGIRDMVHARLAWDRADAKTALERYEAAVTAAPGRPDFWVQYAGVLLQSLRYDDAVRVAERGLQANANDPQLRSILSQARALGQGGPDAELRALIAALETNPGAAETADALRPLATDGAQPPTAPILIQLANRFPTQGILQAYLIRRLGALDVQSAYTIGIAAMRANPTDPAPARALAEVCLSAGRFRDMVEAARRWRDRDRSGSPEPDIALAQAYLGLREPPPGLEALDRHLAKAKERPEDAFSPLILNMEARLLIIAGREPEARALLEPLLAKSQTIRMAVWLGTARDFMPSLDAALAWVERLPASIPADQPSEKVAVAKGYYILAERFKDQSSDLFQRALATMTELSRDPATATGELFQALAVTRQRTGDLTGAEEAYLKAVSLDPRDHLSLNNLAYMALQAGDLPRAKDLATKAVEAMATPDNLDTLASVFMAMGRERAKANDQAGAREQYRLASQNYRKAAALAAGPGAWANAATADERAGDHASAVQAYERILGMGQLGPADAALIRNNMAMDLLRLNRGAEDLQRARSLINEAVRAKAHWALYDTKGWVELQRGDATEAEAAFRRAMELYRESGESGSAGGGPLSSMIGLATVLAKGNAEQRAEAARQLEGVEPARLESDEERGRLERARQLLATPAR